MYKLTRKSGLAFGRDLETLMAVRHPQCLASRALNINKISSQPASQSTWPWASPLRYSMVVQTSKPSSKTHPVAEVKEAEEGSLLFSPALEIKRYSPERKEKSEESPFFPPNGIGNGLLWPLKKPFATGVTLRIWSFSLWYGGSLGSHSSRSEVYMCVRVIVPVSCHYCRGDLPS